MGEDRKSFSRSNERFRWASQTATTIRDFVEREAAFPFPSVYFSISSGAKFYYNFERCPAFNDHAVMKENSINYFFPRAPGAGLAKQRTHAGRVSSSYKLPPLQISITSLNRGTGGFYSGATIRQR